MRRWSWLTPVNLSLILVIVLLDWATPAGVVVGILLSVPIVLASLTSRPREVWLTFGVAITSFLAAALLGADPISPRAVWLPNRVFVLLALPASCAVALLLQERRLEAQRARDAAIRTGELNRLLLSLLAHDLRSPMGMAIQAFDYVRDAAERGEAPKDDLLRDVQARLRRKLGTVDDLLTIAQAELRGPGAASAVSPFVDLTEALRSEVLAFESEASTRGKTLVLDAEGLGRRRVPGHVLRQAVAILVDNAVRHAGPGTIRVSAAASGSEVVVRVSDDGPGLTPRETETETGSGLGLDLCRVLVARAGGRLETTEAGPARTTFQLTLPVG